MAEPIRRLVEDLVCVECGREWGRPGRAVAGVPDRRRPPQPVTYCPDCAEREFELKGGMPGS